MLRLIFVFIIIAIGVLLSAQGPFYALLFYLWNAYFRPESWTYGGAVMSLNLSWIIGIYLVLRTAVSVPSPRLNWRTGLLALFFGASLISALLSENPDWSWRAWVEFSKVLLISYLIVVLTTDRRKYRQVLLVISLSLGLECAKQGWALMVLAPGAKNDNPIPFLGDNNGVALGTMMLVPIIGALAQTAGPAWERLSHKFLLIGVFMRGLTTYSRGGFLSAAILGIVGFVRSRRRVRYTVSVAVISILVLSVMPQQFWDRMETINAPSEERDDSAAGRIYFWSVGLKMGNAKPFTGVGFSGYNPAYESYNTREEYLGPRSPHSIWFGVLGEMGWVGLLLFVTIWATSLWSAWRVSVACKGDARRKDLKAYADALMSSLVVYAVGGSFLAAQYSEMAWHLFALSTTLTLLAREAEVSTVIAATAPASAAAGLTGATVWR